MEFPQVLATLYIHKYYIVLVYPDDDDQKLLVFMSKVVVSCAPTVIDT